VVDTNDEMWYTYGTKYDLNTGISSSEYPLLYTEPQKGEETQAVIPFPTNTEVHVAVLHTHSAYNVNYKGDQFSSQDREVAREVSIPIYVATPGGMLLKYDPTSVYDLILFDDFPYDPNHPKWSEKE